MSEAALVGPAREEFPAELMPLRASDAKVWHIIERMIAKTWVRGRSADELVIEWGCSLALVERYAVEASRFLRLIREPELIRARVLARLTEIGEEDEGDRVPALLGAAKVSGILDQKGEAVKPPELSLTERNERVRQTFSDPPPELVAIMRECRAEILKALGEP